MPQFECISPRVRRGSRAFVAPFIAASLTFAQTASAQQQPSAAELATRRRFIEEAQRLRGQNRHQEALDAAQRAMTIQPSPSLRMLVAQEEFAVGRYAEAFGDADLCMRDAVNDRQPNAATVAATCRQLVEQVRPRIGNVVINVGPEAVQRAAGLRLVVNDHDVSTAVIGAPYVVSPGRVHIEVSATGWRNATQDVDVAAGATANATLTLEEAPVAQPDPTPTNTVREIREIREIRESNDPRVIVIQQPGGNEPTGPGAGPYVLMALGGVGLLGSAGLYIGSLVSRSACQDGQCPYQRDSMGVPVRDSSGNLQYPDYDRIVALELGSVISAGVGAALLVGGVVWRVVAGNPRPRAAQPGTVTVQVRPQARLEPAVDPFAGRAGLTVRW